ncbi:MAG: hypothetical protein OCD76_02380 [Reichenbachiella sp.]
MIQFIKYILITSTALGIIQCSDTLSAELFEASDNSSAEMSSSSTVGSGVSDTGSDLGNENSSQSELSSSTKVKGTGSGNSSQSELSSASKIKDTSDGVVDLVIFADSYDASIPRLFGNSSFDGASWRYNHEGARNINNRDVSYENSLGLLDSAETKCSDTEGNKSTDGGNCMKIDFAVYESWGGFFLQFGDYVMVPLEWDAAPNPLGGELENREPEHLKDFSDYFGKTLKFEIASKQDLTLKIERGLNRVSVSYKVDIEKILLKQGVVFDGTWQSVAIPLTVSEGFSEAFLSEIAVLFGLWTGNIQGSILIDNIRIE